MADENLAGLSDVDYDSLSNEELIALYHKTGNPDIVDVLLRHNEPLIQDLVNRFLTTLGISFGERRYYDVNQELMQLGMLGFDKAILKYDPSKNVRLATFAVPVVQSALYQYFAENRTIYLPEEVRRRLNRIAKATKAFAKEYHHDPSDSELAAYLNDGTTAEQLSNYRMIPQSALSLNHSSAHGDDDDEDDRSLEERLGGEEASVSDTIEMEYQNEKFLQAFRRLKKREQDILIKTKLRGIPAKQVAEDYQISEARVSSIIANAMKTLNEDLKD